MSLASPKNCNFRGFPFLSQMIRDNALASILGVFFVCLLLSYITQDMTRSKKYLPFLITTIDQNVLISQSVRENHQNVNLRSFI